MSSISNTTFSAQKPSMLEKANRHVIWGSACNAQVTPILVTNKDKHCNVPGPLAHTNTLFHKPGIIIIFDIYKLQVGKLVYESLNRIGPSKLIIKFTKVSEMHSYNTRFAKKGDIYNNYARTTRFGLKSLQNIGGKIWGSIPINMTPLHLPLMSKMKKNFVHAYSDLQETYFYYQQQYHYYYYYYHYRCVLYIYIFFFIFTFSK